MIPGMAIQTTAPSRCGCERVRGAVRRLLYRPHPGRAGGLVGSLVASKRFRREFDYRKGIWDHSHLYLVHVARVC